MVFRPKSDRQRWRTAAAIVDHERVALELARKDAEDALVRCDSKAALRTLEGCVIALRTIVERNEMPDDVRLASLPFLLSALVEIIEKGQCPSDALRLVNPDYRPANEALPIRDAYLFARVGRELDKLTARGWTRSDKPAMTAIAQVAKSERIASATVQKAWSKHGSARGWARRRADWKEAPD